MSREQFDRWTRVPHDAMVLVGVLVGCLGLMGLVAAALLVGSELEFSADEFGTDVALALIILGPGLVMCVVGVALCVAGRRRVRRRRREYFDRYQAQGWVARQLPTGVFVPHPGRHMYGTRDDLPVVLLTAPGQQRADLEPVAALVRSRVDGMTSDVRTQWKDAVRALGPQRGVGAGELLPELPPLVVAWAREAWCDGSFAVVLPERDGTTVLGLSFKTTDVLLAESVV